MKTKTNKNMKNKKKKNEQNSIALGIKLNLSAIDKSVLFKGDKGIYLDAKVYINEEEDIFGNRVKVIQKDKDNRTNYIGNGIVFKDENDGEFEGEMSLSFKIDLKKIEPESIYKGESDYLDCTVYINEEEDDFGYIAKMIYKNSEEEVVYIGNGKKAERFTGYKIDKDDLPF